MYVNSIPCSLNFHTSMKSQAMDTISVPGHVASVSKDCCHSSSLKKSYSFDLPRPLVQTVHVPAVEVCTWYVHTSLATYMHIHTVASPHTVHTYMYTSVVRSTTIYLHTFLKVCMSAHTYMHTCPHAYMLNSIHAYMHACLHAYNIMRKAFHSAYAW